MKRKVFYMILGCEAVICILLSFAKEILPNVFSTIVSFPFEQISLGLRILSLSGSIGNILAVFLYLVFCLIPIAVLFFIRKKGKLCLADSLLAVLSFVLFISIYLLINPGMLGTYIGNVNSQVLLKALLGGIIYSVLIGHIVLRIMSSFFTANTKKLQLALGALLSFFNVLFVYLVFGTYFGELLDSFATLRTGNVGNEQYLTLTYVFLVLQYVINALPYILDVFIVFCGLTLLKELDDNRYSESAVLAAEKLSHICGLSLIISIISNMGFNLLQLVFVNQLRVINGSLQIPIISVAFVLVTLLFSQYIKENKQLKDDNDMFI